MEAKFFLSVVKNKNLKCLPGNKSVTYNYGRNIYNFISLLNLAEL